MPEIPADWYRQDPSGAWELVPEEEAQQLRGGDTLRSRVP